MLTGLGLVGVRGTGELPGDGWVLTAPESKIVKESVTNLPLRT